MRSFPFFIKERNVLFGFISHTKIANLAKKERKRTQHSFFYKDKKECSVFFQYIFIYIYLYISLCTSIYILKKELNILHSFAKECCVLCVLMGLISRQKLEKRTGKKRNVPLKEWKRMKRTKRKRTLCPTLP